MPLARRHDERVAVALHAPCSIGPALEEQSHTSSRPSRAAPMSGLPSPSIAAFTFAPASITPRRPRHRRRGRLVERPVERRRGARSRVVGAPLLRPRSRRRDGAARNGSDRRHDEERATRRRRGQQPGAATRWLASSRAVTRADKVAALRHPERLLRAPARHPPRERDELLGVRGALRAPDHTASSTRARRRGTGGARPSRRAGGTSRRRTRAGHHLDGPVAAPHVLELVDERAAQVGLAPRTRRGQQDRRSPHAARHRRRDRLVPQDLDGPRAHRSRPQAIVRARQLGARAGRPPKRPKPQQVEDERCERSRAPTIQPARRTIGRRGPCEAAVWSPGRVHRRRRPPDAGEAAAGGDGGRPAGCRSSPGARSPRPGARQSDGRQREQRREGRGQQEVAPRGARAAREPGRGQTQQRAGGSLSPGSRARRNCSARGPTSVIVCHGGLLSLRTRSISARRASSSSSVQVSCFSSAVTVWPGEPPKKMRTSCCSAVRCADARDVVGA